MRALIIDKMPLRNVPMPQPQHGALMECPEDIQYLTRASGPAIRQSGEGLADRMHCTDGSRRLFWLT